MGSHVAGTHSLKERGWALCVGGGGVLSSTADNVLYHVKGRVCMCAPVWLLVVDLVAVVGGGEGCEGLTYEVSHPELVNLYK